MPHNRNSAHVECESKSDTGSNRDDWNYFNITQTIPEHHKGKREIKKIIKKKHTGHSTHTAESANVKVQNIFHGRNNITWSANCKYRTVATLYTVDILFVSDIKL